MCPKLFEKDQTSIQFQLNLFLFFHHLDITNGKVCNFIETETFVSLFFSLFLQPGVKIDPELQLIFGN